MCRGCTSPCVSYCGAIASASLQCVGRFVIVSCGTHFGSGHTAGCGLIAGGGIPTDFSSSTTSDGASRGIGW